MKGFNMTPIELLQLTAQVGLALATPAALIYGIVVTRKESDI